MIPKASGLALPKAAVGPAELGPGRGRPEFGVDFSQHLAHYFFQIQFFRILTADAGHIAPPYSNSKSSQA
jgi:hypothetical protein